MSEHKHVIKFDVKTYPCECGLEFSQELAETLVEAALRGSLPTVQLGIDLEFEKRRVAELEAESERFTVHSNIERQDDNCSNDTQTDAVVYDKWIPVSERLPDGGHREFYEVACIYQDFGELALFSKGRWVIYEGENVYDVTKRVKFWRKRQHLPDEVIAVLSKGEMNPEVME